jgi:hypothetical protein
VCSGADAARSVGEAAIRGLLEIRGERLAVGSVNVVSRYFGFHIGGRIAVSAALDARGLNVQGLTNNGRQSRSRTIGRLCFV